MDAQHKGELVRWLKEDALAPGLATELWSPDGQVRCNLVEAFNWCWPVDGLMEAGCSVKLVNTAKERQYDGLKYTDDRHDAFWPARKTRLGILPTGYINPKEQRAVRDPLRV